MFIIVDMQHSQTKNSKAKLKQKMAEAEKLKKAEEKQHMEKLNALKSGLTNMWRVVADVMSEGGGFAFPEGVVNPDDAEGDEDTVAKVTYGTVDPSTYPGLVFPAHETSMLELPTSTAPSQRKIPPEARQKQNKTEQTRTPQTHETNHKTIQTTSITLHDNSN